MIKFNIRTVDSSNLGVAKQLNPKQLKSKIETINFLTNSTGEIKMGSKNLPTYASGDTKVKFKRDSYYIFTGLGTSILKINLVNLTQNARGKILLEEKIDKKLKIAQQDFTVQFEAENQLK